MGKIQTDALTADILTASHALVAGMTGAGKSTILNTVITTGIRAGGMAFVLIDPKRVEFRRFVRAGCVWRYACTPPKIRRTLSGVSRLMARRSVAMTLTGSQNWRGVPLFVVVDEIADLIATDKTALAELEHIARIGRALGVHLIAATQSPSRKTIPAGLLVNIPFRVALACQTPTESRQIIGVSGAELLPIPSSNDADQTRTVLVYKAGSRSLYRYKVRYTPPDAIRKTVNRNTGAIPTLFKI